MTIFRLSFRKFSLESGIFLLTFNVIAYAIMLLNFRFC